MLWGGYLCLQTRHVAAQFTDSRELSIVIYAFTVVTFLAVVLEYALATGKSDHQLLIDTLRTQCTVTVTLFIIFGPKLRAVYHGTTYYKRRQYRKGRGTSRQVSHHSINSLDRARQINRGRKASVLSRKSSTGSTNGVPLERRVSRMTMVTAVSRSTVGSASSNPHPHTTVYRSLSASTTRMSPHIELETDSSLSIEEQQNSRLSTSA